MATPSPPRAIWNISAIGNTLGLLDIVSTRKGGNNKRSPDVPVFLFSREAPQFDRDESSKVKPKKNKSGSKKVSSLKGKNKDGGDFCGEAYKGPPAVHYLDNAPHLAHYNPLLFVVEGPGDYTSPLKAEITYSAADFVLRPRFALYDTLDRQMQEYAAKLSSEWSTKATFELWWEKVFSECFINTIEARAPLLSVKTNNEMHLSVLKQLIHTFQMVEYVNANAVALIEKSQQTELAGRDVDEERDEEDEILLDLEGNNSNGASPSSKKRKRANMTASSMLSVDDSSNGAASQSEIAMRNETAQDICIHDYYNQMNRGMDPVVKAAVMEIASATVDTILTGPKYSGKYFHFHLAFTRAVKNVASLMFDKSKCKFRQAVHGYLIARDQRKDVSDPVQGSDLNSNTGEGGGNGGGGGSDMGDLMETDNENATTTTTTTTTTRTGGSATASIVFVSEDSLTCSYIALRILSEWSAALKMTDKRILDHYTNLSCAVDIKYQLSFVQKMQNVSPLDPYEKCTAIFPSLFYYQGVSLSYDMCTLFRLVPNWSLPMLRAFMTISGHESTFNENPFSWATFIAVCDKITGSVTQRFLHYVVDKITRVSKEREARAQMTTVAGVAPVEVAPLSRDLLEDLPVLVARERIGLSVFEKVHRDANTYFQAIFNLIEIIISRTPTPRLSNEEWHAAFHTMALQNSHYVQRLNTQVDLYKSAHDIKKTQDFLTPYFYYQPPSSASAIDGSVKLGANPREIIYWTVTRENTTVTKRQFQMTSFNDDEEEGGGEGGIVDNSDSNKKTYIMACNRLHCETWMEICEFFQQYELTIIGRWYHYLHYRTAVDQSIAMGLVPTNHFMNTLNANELENDSLIIYLPLVILEQMRVVMDRKGSESDSTWTNVYFGLTTNACFKVATASIIGEILQERLGRLAACGMLEADDDDDGEDEDDKKKKAKKKKKMLPAEDEDLTQSDLPKFPRMPRIYIPHIDFLTPMEYKALIKAIRETVGEKSYDGLERTCRDRLFATSCPFHGGFSMNYRDSYEGSNYYLFMLASAHKNPIFNFLDGVIEKIVPDKYLTDFTVWADKEGIDNKQIQMDNIDIGAVNGSDYGDLKELVFDYCEKFMLTDFNSEQPHKERLVGSVIKSASNFRLHSINHIRSYGTDPILSRRWGLLAKSTKGQIRYLDQNKVVETAEANRKDRPPSAFVNPPAQGLLQTGLIMSHMSIPDYKAIELYEVTGRPCQVIPINLTEDKLFTIPPMVLLNILIRHRQKTVQFVGGRKAWELYKAEWSSKKYISHFLTVGSQRGSSSSIPIDATFSYGIRISDIKRAEEEYKLREIERRRKRDQHLPQNLLSVQMDVDSDAGGFIPPTSSLVRRASSAATLPSALTEKISRERTQPLPPLNRTISSLSIDLDESTQDAWGESQLTAAPTSLFSAVTSPTNATNPNNKKKVMLGKVKSPLTSLKSSGSSMDIHFNVDDSSRMSDNGEFY